MRVLLVASGSALRAIVKPALMTAGRDVVTVKTVEGARAMLASGDPPPVAVVDASLEGALELVRERADATTPYFVVVGSPDLARAAGADEALGRDGLDPATLAAAVEAGARALGPATEEAPLVGQTIDGRYVVTGILGRGGMGVVYRGRHKLVGEPVAIKVIHDAMASRPGFRERFLTEARILMRLSHEHVVVVRDCGETKDGLLYLALALSPGAGLGDIVRAAGRLDEARAVAIARQVALALEAAHALGIVHRDLKPDNVLVEPGDRVRILDFGLAKLAQEDGPTKGTTAGLVVGTPHYMAPEQAADEHVDGRADLYALGCLLYEMVVGVRPFDGSTSRVMELHLTEPPVPPTRRGARVSTRLEALILRLLAKERDDRPQSARAVVEALDALAAHGGSSRRLRILVADESGPVRRLVVGLLERAGHDAEEACDGAEAAARSLEPAPFDAVILGGGLPVLDGRAAAARIRAEEARLGRRTMLVLLSSRAGEADRAAALAGGLDALLAKPVTPSALDEVLAKAARGAAPEPELPLFDRRGALARVENDAALLREVLSLFLDETPRIVRTLRAALEAGDAPRLSRSAHELKGAASCCGALAVEAHAARVESRARQGIEQARPWIPALFVALARTGPALAAELERSLGPGSA